MTRSTPYPAYKESNISWLDEIPSEWSSRRLKHIFRIKKKIANKTGLDVLSITQRGIKIKDIESGEGQLAMDYSKYQLINRNDFAMNHMDLLTGFVDISQFDGVISPDYRVFELIDKDSHPEYLLFALQMCYYDKIFYGFGQGSSQLGRWRLSAEEFNNFVLPYPGKDEQIKIANFLSHKVRQIENLISAATKTVDLLYERAFRLVIHGKNAPLEVRSWADNFPNNWRLEKAKWIFNEINIKNKPEEELLAVTQNRGVIPKKLCEENFVSPSELGLKSQKYVPKNSYVISLRSFQGGIEFSEYNGIVSPAYNVFQFRKEYKNVSNQIFYRYLFKARPFIQLLNTVISGIRDGQNISFYDFGNLYLPLPDHSTLIELEELDSVIELEKIKVEKTIKLLRQLKTEIIATAVTGKIDVRNKILTHG